MPEWKHGLCSCCTSCASCCCVMWCPCLVFGQSWEKMGSSCIGCGFASFVPILECVLLTQLRGKVREMRGIEGTLCGDLAASWICSCCTLIQIRDELADVEIQRS